MWIAEERDLSKLFEAPEQGNPAGSRSELCAETGRLCYPLTYTIFKLGKAAISVCHFLKLGKTVSHYQSLYTAAVVCSSNFPIFVFSSACCVFQENMELACFPKTSGFEMDHLWPFSIPGTSNRCGIRSQQWETYDYYYHYYYSIYIYIWLGGPEHVLRFHILGMSSTQLTFIFFRGVWLNHQPAVYIYIYSYIHILMRIARTISRFKSPLGWAERSFFHWLVDVASGKCLNNHGKSPFYNG